MQIKEYKLLFPGAPIISKGSAEKKSKSIKKTCMERYGVMNPSYLDNVQDKRKISLKRTLAVKKKDGTLQKGLDKRNKTLIERYGTTNLNLIPTSVEKRRKTLIERYGVDSPLKNKDILEKKLKNTNFDDAPNGTEEIILSFNIPNVKYTGDRQIWIYLPSYGFKNPDFTISNLDKVVIEMYGEYWHRKDNPFDIMDAYNEVGYICLVVQERDLLDRPEKCKQDILNFIQISSETIRFISQKNDKDIVQS
jgi:hypothetical protein